MSEGMRVDWWAQGRSRESDRSRSYELPLPGYMERVPAGYFACECDEERDALILEYHAKQRESLTQ